MNTTLLFNYPIKFTFIVFTDKVHWSISRWIQRDARYKVVNEVTMYNNCAGIHNTGNISECHVHGTHLFLSSLQTFPPFWSFIYNMYKYIYTYVCMYI